MKSCKLFDYHVSNEYNARYGGNPFAIKMFGVGDDGSTYCLHVDDFRPFFYIYTDTEWTEDNVDALIAYIREKVGEKYVRSITSHRPVEMKKLYGFDAGAYHSFLYLEFFNTSVFNKVKRIWNTYDEGVRSVKLPGMTTRIYESGIPPILRFFHINNIAPSGWIEFDPTKARLSGRRTTTCTYEHIISKKDIRMDSEKEASVPVKVCSFDIEASSSHGDFPLAKKDYKKLSSNLVEYWEQFDAESESDEDQIELIMSIIRDAFKKGEREIIDKIYPKRSPTEKEFSRFETKYTKSALDILNQKKKPYDDKLNGISRLLGNAFPDVEGDKVTFIGSTFWKGGEESTYLNHCIALGKTDSLPDQSATSKTTIISVNSEKELLLAWTKLIQEENPDIVIGYNIFGFDFGFMYERAQELNITKAFMKLSRNRDEVCKLTEKTVNIASGTHELKYIEMPGRINIDLYNHFRREFNLESYKLDNVAGHFIGDYVNEAVHTRNGHTQISTGNLTGLHVGSFVNFEEIGHSAEMYNDGEKFKVTKITAGAITVKGTPKLDKAKKIRWCLAKDDITPQDIFRLTESGDPANKAIIAKYCIQDCNLVHHLMNKIDVLTGLVEMSNICSVPIQYLVFRGQGIKLYSFLSKKCREMDTLIPDISKRRGNEGYEGAIVLPPKCGMYLDEPVACVDYSSLYPSSIISENLSHDSKVWTKEYDLKGRIIKKTGSHEYDNLEGYTYVDVTYDTYEYKQAGAAQSVKTKVGHKICRFAQFPEGKSATIPAVLKELLAARKATRRMAKFKTITTQDGGTFTGTVIKENDRYIVTDKDVRVIPTDQVVSIADTYNSFMKNVFDKRQIGYKLTANSMYGQTGAKTSNFYEIDVAAATTAVGRMLLTYARRVIEETYGDRICDTKYGKVHSHGEYIYGDTDSVFMSFKLTELDGTPIKGKRALEITIELAKEAGTLATKFLKKPHDLEYEKTFMPFVLLSKKRYVGMLYEEDPDKCKRKSMGIVLKRRDNAPVVKDIYGGVIDILMKEQNVVAAIDFTKQALRDLAEGKLPMSKLIITKSLRSYYKNPKQIAHKVLANRMGTRDPGNKPGAGDRIPFAYVQTAKKTALQGERIEHPAFIKENRLKLDYEFYITNQLMKPLLQVFSLVLEDIPAFRRRVPEFRNKLRVLRETCESDEAYDKKETKLRNDNIERLIFTDILREVKNKRQGNISIASYFG